MSQYFDSDKDAIFTIKNWKRLNFDQRPVVFVEWFGRWFFISLFSEGDFAERNKPLKLKFRKKKWEYL